MEIYVLPLTILAFGISIYLVIRAFRKKDPKEIHHHHYNDDD